MNENVFQLRKALHLTQEEFAKKLGITGSGLSNIESGKRSLTEQMIKAICREFNVSYAWLTEGLGDMFVSEDMETMAFFDRIMAGENETAKALFKAFAKLDDSDWETLRKIIKEANKYLEE